MAPKSKFNDEIATEAYRLYQKEGQTYRQIGQRFSLSRQTASKAVKRGQFLTDKLPSEAEITTGLSAKEASERLNISPAALIYHLQAGTLIGRKIGGRLYIDEASVDKFKPLEREEAVPGRPTNIERGLPEPVVDRGKLSIYLGQNINLEEIAWIRKLLNADLRARVLLRLAYLSENEPENYKRALESIGVEL